MVLLKYLSLFHLVIFHLIEKCTESRVVSSCYKLRKLSKSIGFWMTKIHLLCFEFEQLMKISWTLHQSQYYEVLTFIKLKTWLGYQHLNRTSTHSVLNLLLMRLLEKYQYFLIYIFRGIFSVRELIFNCAQSIIFKSDCFTP